jgi:hypothetical protein
VVRRAVRRLRNGSKEGISPLGTMEAVAL